MVNQRQLKIQLDARVQTMGIVNTVLIALLLICEVFGEADDYIGCTSVVKLLNVKIDRRLHSHDVRYGSGSGQQHSSTGCLLHSHSAFACPFSGNQEVSCFGKNGIGDEGDNWIVLCDKKYWEKGDEVQFKHLQTDHWSLSTSLCIFLLFIRTISAATFILYVFRSNETDVEFFDDCTASSATFGLAIVAEEVTMCTLAVEPILACGQLPPAPTHFNSTPFCISGYYAIARRGNCSFAKKVKKIVLILFSSKVEQLIVSQICRHSMRKKLATQVCLFTMTTMRCFPWLAMVQLLFAFILRPNILSFRWFRNQQRLQRRRLTRRQLKKIPNRKYKKGDEHEMCAICLEDFADGDKMRLLPCGHVYHCACVDPWLLKNRKVCPVCKRKVTDDSDDSDWDSADEQPAAPSEHSPLFSNLSSSRSSSAGDLQVGNSTFYTNYGSTGCGLCPYSFCRPRAEHDNGMLKQRAKKPSLFHINCSAEVSTVPVSSGGQQQQQQQHAVASTSSASTGVDNLSFVQDSISISSVAADPSEPTASTSYPAPSSSSDPPTTTQLP
ncbi:E3 ubiquitin-protein ligase RNF13 [Trichinella sp. T9]|nr:E3 ubiquitin-protein ligase RNF13 [Trichinella sp. T9]